ncbi:MAG: hypothetical protein GVY32_07555 [Gammaproteobacteria bacterium]|nr:hypothetical protein [Gammaproteobacteria bacterium]
MKTIRLWAFASATLLVLSACGPAEEQQPETVEERAQARWNLLAEGEFEQAWAYYTPGFRERIEQDDFARDMSRRPVTWLGAEVLGSTCEEPDRCTVTVEVAYRAEVPGLRQTSSQVELSRRLEDEWIRLDGQWWYVKN